jgi:hypothetical protein
VFFTFQCRSYSAIISAELSLHATATVIDYEITINDTTPIATPIATDSSNPIATLNA